MAIEFFAPILESTQDVFQLNNENNNIYSIKYKIPEGLSIDEIGNIQLRVLSYSTNQNCLKYDQNNSPDGSYYFFTIPSNSAVEINPSIMFSIPNWQQGQLYKIQLRFGSENISWISPGNNFSDWKKNNINSEWSNIMIIKPIKAPELIINGLNITDYNENKIINTLKPEFKGGCSFEDGDKEFVKFYRFNLYERKGAEDLGVLIESSDWQLRKNNNTIDSWTFKSALKNQEKQYRVSYDIISNNGYNSENSQNSANYYFIIKEEYGTIPIEQEPKLKVDSSSLDCQESGKIDIYLTKGEQGTQTVSSFILLRSSEKDSYQTWEELTHLSYMGAQLDNTLIYSDYSVESGIGYRYGIQELISDKQRSKIFQDLSGFSEHKIYFESSYLLGSGKQLKLKFNNKINNFKKVIFNNKIDTLGQKYPTVIRNGNTNYSEFPISGLISFLMDDGHSFSNVHIENYSTNLTNENIFNEKKFRDEVETFLNNGEPKLFRSATEGNLIVMLTNITFTPNETLGRMLYDFSGTAYEIADNDLENLKKYNIIEAHCGENLPPDGKFVFTTFGMVSSQERLADINLINLIYEDIKKQIKDQNALISIIKINSLRFRPLQDEGPGIVKIILTSTPEKIATSSEGGTEYIFNTNQIYQLKDIFEVYNINGIFTKENILLDYECEIERKMPKARFVTTESQITTWGQVQGIFSDEAIIDNLENTYSQDIFLAIAKKVDEDANLQLEKNSNQTIETNYKVSKIISIRVEAKENSILILKNSESDPEVEILLGPTDKYILNLTISPISKLKFKTPSQAIIDYKCEIEKKITTLAN